MVLILWAFRAATGAGWFRASNPYERLATWLLAGAIVGAAGAALAVWVLRPRNRSAVVLLALSAVMCTWTVALSATGTVATYAPLAAIAFRPLLFWLVLAWPTGRLSRADRTVLLVYTAVLTVCWASWMPSGRSGPMPVYARALNDIGSNVVMPMGAVAVIVVATRRFRRLPRSARRPATLAFVAAVYAATGDIVLVVVNRMLERLVVQEDGRTWLGGLVAVVDIGRFLVVPVLLVGAAVVSRRRAPAQRVRTVEIGPVAANVESSISGAVVDPSVRVAYPAPGTDGGWLDGDGEPATLGGHNRMVTTVHRAGEPVAAIELDARFADRPTLVEAAVAAAASSIEHERAMVLARARLAEARAARRSIVEAEDAAQRWVERDLHDGAQQRLVGLALQVSLAERSGLDDEARLAMLEGVREARADLRDLAAGRLPSLLAERGLVTAIRTLAATTPLAVEVRVDLPATVPSAVAGLAWFVVAEAVANVIKHAGATRVRIDGGVDDGVLSMSVTDDGAGGAALSAGSGLRGLVERATALGGTVIVSGVPDGRGTCVRLDVPVPVPARAAAVPA
jgi:signal transduction histidine kinase